MFSADNMYTCHFTRHQESKSNYNSLSISWMRSASLLDKSMSVDSALDKFPSNYIKITQDKPGSNVIFRYDLCSSTSSL